ncbi:MULTISPECIES: flagellar hook-basal body complex protein FliE [Euryhalocaulis]|uniref:flagellar hook-basal body complex protein FliE n=1 Tax=Euryhalocaulis TaxID=1712422 RepID=UPI00039CBD70|nr:MULTISPECIES: flagellar hook-basal body complex protein FliE [Euryhalocaulis]MBA4802350.1 flagellar hook-basal body complex protein FliE [Euryhalocaulis sp.]
MAANPLAAMNAYAAAAGVQPMQGASQAASAAKAGPSQFTALIENAVQDATDQMANAEQLSMQAATGQAEMIDVVTAVSAAETTMETMLAVRDEVIRAYQEILRMPI